MIGIDPPLVNAFRWIDSGSAWGDFCLFGQRISWGILKRDGYCLENED